MSAPATRFLLARRAGGLASLDLSTGGTFTRSTEASRLISAPTDGSAAFMDWPAANVRRIENRGDGLGDMLLMEGSRTNRILQSRNITVSPSPWSSTTFGTVSRTAAYGPSPDGATLGNRFTAAAGSPGAYGYPQNISALMANPHRISFWVRGTTAGQTLWTNYPAVVWSTVIGGTTYQRVERNGPNTGSSLYLIDTTGSGSFQAQDVIFDLIQAEDGAFPSSPIRTTTAAVTRGADVLSYASGGYPAGFLSAGFRCTVALDCTSAELVTSSLDMRIVQVGANDYLRIRRNGAAVDVDLVCGGVVKGTRAITMATRGLLLTITAQPLLGTVTVSGATTGDGANTVAGAAWAAASTLYIGADNAAGNAMFGRFGRFIEAL